MILREKNSRQIKTGGITKHCTTSVALCVKNLKIIQKKLYHRYKDVMGNKIFRKQFSSLRKEVL